MKPLLSTRHPREYALELVKSAMLEELRDHRNLTARAENLVAITECYDIPIEHLILWIHHPAPGKQWTAAEFRRFAERYAEERSKAPS